jgi:predicted porin
MEYGPFSADAVYSHVNDAVSASALSAAQLANPLVPSDSLAATISDNTAFAALVRYALKPATLFAGYEHITYANPSHPLADGFTDEGGYQVTSLLATNNAYTIKRQLDIFWTGFRYPLMSDVDLSGGYYHITQNSYHGDGCSTSAFAQCSGHEDAVSMVIDYRFAKHWDAYLGSMYSGVADGMASGFLHNSNVGTMSGVRFTF